MPVISQFYGIVIQMFFKENEKHHLPHIHVMYNEFNSVYDFNGNILERIYTCKTRKISRGMDIITFRRT